MRLLALLALTFAAVAIAAPARAEPVRGVTAEAHAGIGHFIALRGFSRGTAQTLAHTLSIGAGYRNDRWEVQARVASTGFEIAGPGNLHGASNLGLNGLDSVFAGSQVRRFVGDRWAFSSGTGVLLIGDSLEKNRARGLASSIAASLLLGNRHGSALLTLEHRFGHFRTDMTMATTLSVGARWR